MILRHATVHKLIKEKGKVGAENVTIQERETELDVGNEKVISLAQQIKETYTTKNGLGYGDFEEDAGIFEQKLSQLHSDEITFISFTRSAMGQLKNAIKEKSLATGGYLLFYEYEEARKALLIIAMLKNKGRFNFNEDLDLTDVQTIDIDNLHIAARINFNKWDADDEHYISFVKGRSQDITDYFKSFIGIDDENYTDSKENTGDLYKVATAYFEVNTYPMERENSAKSQLYTLAMERHSEGRPITIQEIAHVINPENPDHFQEFANSEDYNLPGEIYIDKKEARKLVNFSGGDNLVRVSFSTEALDANRVTYDLEDDSITIHGIPQNIKVHLREYGENEEE